MKKSFRELIALLGAEDIVLRKADCYHPPKEGFTEGTRLGDCNGAQALRIDRNFGLINDVFRTPHVKLKLMIPGHDPSPSVGSGGSLTLLFLERNGQPIAAPDMEQAYRINPSHGLYSISVCFDGKGDLYGKFSVTLGGRTIYHKIAEGHTPTLWDQRQHDPFKSLEGDTTITLKAIADEVRNLTRHYGDFKVNDAVMLKYFEGGEAEKPVSTADALRFVTGVPKRIFEACDYPGFKIAPVASSGNVVSIKIARKSSLVIR